jgi:surfactin synthase thioesterase subunit/acyl carrier protein
MVECMAAHCRQAGLPVRTVCWGLWRDVGMASSHGAATEKKKRSPVNAGGVRVLPMEAADALDAFGLLDNDLAAVQGPTVAIADIAWARQQAPRTARVSLWKRFAIDHAAPAAAIQANSAHHGKTDLTPAVASMEARLHALVCEVLAIDQDTAIPDDMLLAEVGFDSMSGMELRAALARDAGLWLPLKTFRSPTKASILAAYHKAVDEGAQPTATSSTQAPLAPVPSSADAGKALATEQVKPAFASKWLDYIGGNVDTATLRVVCIGDAGGDPANFKSWLAFVDTSRVEVWALHLPRHTTRSAEDPCPSLVAGAATFMSEAFPFLAEKPYALFGQCIGAYYALRFTEEMRNARRLSPAASAVTLPVAILASACPGPSDLGVLTTYTSRPTMYEGLKALSLAIGWSEEEWERFASNTTLYQALVADVSMGGMECGVSEEDPIDVPITVLLGDLDPVVKRRHVASWMGLTSQSFSLEWLRGQGHNMQFEPPLVACVNRLLLRLSSSD